eukprot:CAMPEP_0182881106 /NCGR_PEP_ID=MMETSP0034_2-20130328/16985_1 /TAXON_ID=156128 /ORGANISM="Nephroselmis pyriformis, Strain CCMP717" /LENGTH=68 /DNA_ID=CAMNT_0025014129 /DNA_START=48 /DNA_END=251 /DNA_ORIENTATION=-
MPPVSGSVIWANSLRARVEEPFRRLVQMGGDWMLSTEYGREMEAKYGYVLRALQRYQSDLLSSWALRI